MPCAFHPAWQTADAWATNAAECKLPGVPGSNTPAETFPPSGVCGSVVRVLPLTVAGALRQHIGGWLHVFRDHANRIYFTLSVEPTPAAVDEGPGAPSSVAAGDFGGQFLYTEGVEGQASPAHAVFLSDTPLRSGLTVAEQAQLVSTEAHAGLGGPSRLWSCATFKADLATFCAVGFTWDAELGGCRSNAPAAGLPTAATAPTTDLSGTAVLYIAAEFNLVKFPMAAGGGGALSCGDPRQRGAPGAAALVQRRLVLPLTTLMLPTGDACAKAAAAAAGDSVAADDSLPRVTSATPAAALPALTAPGAAATSAAASSTAAAASTSATSSSAPSYGQYGSGGFTFTMLVLDQDARRQSDEDDSAVAAAATARATDCGLYASWMTKALESLQRRGILKKSLTCSDACVNCWRLAAGETAVAVQLAAPRDAVYLFNYLAKAETLGSFAREARVPCGSTVRLYNALSDTQVDARCGGRSGSGPQRGLLDVPELCCPPDVFAEV
ncbi:hypothetical protein HYH03_017538 [Edaphochlamys debaryana]|uniref:Uncharacterized protein n=1 Tax=Edaphochlamys debaryana TaxID=47281 RepID=A0A836BNT0_9CHLO|nr:hypothetical protein HYH03_017538 [Edaphochlamys debaryana]|eukprot:KAG2483596.1 hypothetical protein HYH03_017538 [Edaphochlamys debaryana]